MYTQSIPIFIHLIISVECHWVTLPCVGMGRGVARTCRKRCNEGNGFFYRETTEKEAEREKLCKNEWTLTDVTKKRDGPPSVREIHGPWSSITAAPLAGNSNNNKWRKKTGKWWKKNSRQSGRHLRRRRSSTKFDPSSEYPTDQFRLMTIHK